MSDCSILALVLLALGLGIPGAIFGHVLWKEHKLKVWHREQNRIAREFPGDKGNG